MFLSAVTRSNFSPVVPALNTDSGIEFVGKPAEYSRQVRDAWSYFERIPLRLLEVTVPKALGLAEQLGLYAYDAYIIEAARAQRVPLLAMDGRLRTAAAELGLEVWEVTS